MTWWFGNWTPGKPGCVRFSRRLGRSSLYWTAYVRPAYFMCTSAAGHTERVTLVRSRSKWRTSYTQTEEIRVLPLLPYVSRLCDSPTGVSISIAQNATSITKHHFLRLDSMMRWTIHFNRLIIHYLLSLLIQIIPCSKIGIIHQRWCMNSYSCMCWLESNSFLC